ncbi:MAG TPA: class I SAM-dependent methyltransferase [Acidimicrobiales bacterium]|nr:class I SAM-dependent methyltransferase [Acidimicrobiales bacterium]
MSWSGEAYDAWYERPWGGYASAVETGAVLAATGPLAGRRVLDAGCGTGRLLASLAAGGAGAVGVDLSPTMLAVAARRTGAPLVRGDVGALPFPHAAFDAVVGVAVLEFVGDPAVVVAELCRVVRPGGRVVLGVLNPRSPWGAARRRELREPPWSAAGFLTRRRLRELARPYGRSTVRGVLFLPGPVPGMSCLGPVTECLGRLAPSTGAFQVLTIHRR